MSNAKKYAGVEMSSIYYKYCVMCHQQLINKLYAMTAHWTRETHFIPIYFFIEDPKTVFTISQKQIGSFMCFSVSLQSKHSSNMCHAVTIVALCFALFSALHDLAVKETLVIKRYSSASHFLANQRIMNLISFP